MLDEGKLVGAVQDWYKVLCSLNYIPNVKMHVTNTIKQDELYAMETYASIKEERAALPSGSTIVVSKCLCAYKLLVRVVGDEYIIEEVNEQG